MKKKQDKKPFSQVAGEKLAGAGYFTVHGHAWTKHSTDGLFTVVLKNKATSEEFRGYPQMTAALLYKDGMVQPLFAGDILNLGKGIVNE